MNRVYSAIFRLSKVWAALSFCYVLCGLYTASLAQGSVQFEHVSAEHRLSNDAVYCITQDRHGFIWIGTEDGLNRFDGQEMVVFRHDPADLGSISYNWLRSIHEDNSGQIWVGHNNGLDRLDPEAGQVERIHQFRQNDTTINLDLISRIYEDKLGGIWFGGVQIIYFDPASQTFNLYPIQISEADQAEIQFLGVNDQGKLLAGNLNGLFELDPQMKTFQPLVEVVVRGGHFDQDGNLWIVGSDDLLRFNTADQRLDTIAIDLFSQVGYLAGRDIVSGESGELWVGGTNRGLLRIDPGSDRIDAYQHDPQDENSKAPGLGTSLFVDRDGSLWVGGVNGLDRLPANALDQLRENTTSPPFDHVQVIPTATVSPDQEMIRCFLKDQHGYFWIGTYDGLYKYRRQGGELELVAHLTHDPANSGTLSAKDIRMLMEDQRGDIWVSTRQGLNRIDGQSGLIERLYFDGYGLNGLSDEVFWFLCEDDQGRIWIGTEKSGLLRLDPGTRKNQRYLYDPNETANFEKDVVKILQDRKGRIWAGTYGGGLNLYDPATDAFINFMPGDSDMTSIAGNIVWAIFEDEQDRLWIGTQNGLNQLITESDTGETSYRFEHYSEKDGLVNNAIYSIMQDALGRLWITTIDGLSCFDPEAKTFLNLGPEDGLPVYSFTPHAGYKDTQTGDFLLGGVNGYVRFQPTSFQADTVAPPVVISSLTRFNKQVNNGNPIVDYFVAGQADLRFSYLDDIIIFNLALLNFKNNAKNQYMYWLEGLQDHWIPLGTDRKITFTDLAPGTYTLRIKGANHHGVWTTTETRITLTIVPPWWWTNLAKIIYLLLGAGATLGIYRYQLNKKLLEQEARQLKELDEVKSRFFTNISHEFRTPLTVISGMVTQMEQQPDRWMEKGIELIKRNSHQLLSLINQILDLRKLESGALEVHLVRGNIVPYLEYISGSFIPMAQAKGLRVHVLATQTELEMDYDPDKMLRILSNLLSNAIKFTPGPGDIYLQIDRRSDTGKDQLMIQVKDTGQGIPEKALPYIFDHFYQVDPDSQEGSQQLPGSGVGLALTRELVILLGGSIEADSVPGAGTTFTVSLPVTRNAPIQSSTVPVLKKDTSFTVATAPKAPQPVTPPVTSAATPETEALAARAASFPTLLIVEDNPDVRLYLSACLGAHYQLLVAENGQEGIDQAIEAVPDLIVSDVMMPVKDGFVLCDNLKNDERTSHIPIVLLTARADFESRIKGLRKGADAYLAKPFEQEELMVVLQNLLEVRRKLQRKFANLYVDRKNEVEPDQVASEVDAIEDAFLQKLQQIILQHIDDTELSAEFICRQMGMSNTNLYRKLKALTDLSLTHFIRHIRLREAKSLLSNTEMNIAEVAYAVGFADPKYFSRVFSGAFQQSPSQFRGQ